MENYDVVELKKNELRDVGGGWVRLIYALAVDTITHWETYKASFMEGYNSVRN